jgi:hypothetical protein
MFLAASFFLIAGCQTAMSNQATATVSTRDPETYPLHFKQHNFEAHCYNTLDCKVIYDNANQTLYGTGKPSPAPPSDDYRERWGGASYIGVRNFPGPVQIDWTSRDGEAHRAQIDLSEIFKDELILHRTPIEEIPEKAFKGPAGEPDIFVEVNDRTVTVYMKMFIPTKAPQIPGNKNSRFRDDLIKAWSRTY